MVRGARGASVDNGFETRLLKHAILKYMSNIHCICLRLALTCADSNGQLAFLEYFKDRLIQL